jgi:iron complex outermembrane receptor protein
VKRVELSLAGRYEDFGSGVNSFDPRIGIVVTPVDDLTVRATYSTAFRTASLNQLFSTQVGGSTVVLPDGSATTVLTNFVGNPSVAPETSKSVNFGIEYHRNGWRGELDLWDFRFKDIVGTVAPQDFFDQNPNSPLISYDANGVPIEFTLPITNLSSIKTNGIDFNLGYTADLGRWGILDLDTSTTYVHKYDIQTVPGGPVVDGVGQRQYASNFAAPMPRWRGNYRAMLSFGPERMYRASLSGHYVDSIQDPVRPTPAESFFPIDLRLSATLNNLSRLVGGDVVSNAVVSLSVNNMLDEAPPPIVNDNITFEDRLYVGYGRQYVLGVNLTF